MRVCGGGWCWLRSSTTSRFPIMPCYSIQQEHRQNITIPSTPPPPPPFIIPRFLCCSLSHTQHSMPDYTIYVELGLDTSTATIYRKCPNRWWNRKVRKPRMKSSTLPSIIIIQLSHRKVITISENLYEKSFSLPVKKPIMYVNWEGAHTRHSGYE